MSAGSGPRDVDAVGAQARDRRSDDGDVFLAERAVLAGMRIETGDDETRPRNGEARAQVVRHDPAGLDDEVGGQPADHVAQRQVDGDRHHGEFRRPQHHHRMHRHAGVFLGELGEIFGMSRLGEARAVEHVLGDRIGDDRARRAGLHVGDGAADGGDRDRRARCVGAAWLAPSR